MPCTVGGGLHIELDLDINIDLSPPGIGIGIGLSLEICPILTIVGGISLSLGFPLAGFPAGSPPTSVAGGSGLPALPFVAPSGGLLPNLVGAVGGLLNLQPVGGGTSLLDLGGTHITMPVFPNT